MAGACSFCPHTNELAEAIPGGRSLGWLVVHSPAGAYDDRPFNRWLVRSARGLPVCLPVCLFASLPASTVQPRPCFVRASVCGRR